MSYDKKEEFHYGTLKFILRSHSIKFLIIYAVLFFPVFGGFPEYARGIYGNQSIPPTVQSVFVYFPIGIWGVLGILLIFALGLDIYFYYEEQKEHLKKMKNK